MYDIVCIYIHLEVRYTEYSSFIMLQCSGIHGSKRDKSHMLFLKKVECGHWSIQWHTTNHSYLIEASRALKIHLSKRKMPVQSLESEGVKIALVHRGIGCGLSWNSQCISHVVQNQI